MRALLKKQFGQSAESWADLNNVIVWRYINLIDDPSRKVLVVQKILSESLDWRDADFLERRPYLGELHVD